MVWDGLGRSVTSRGTLGEVLETLREVRDGSGNLLRGREQIG